MVELVSSDKRAIRVSHKAALLSSVLANVLEDVAPADAADFRIPVPDIDSSVLKRVVEFMERHSQLPDKPSREQSVGLSAWNAEYIRDISKSDATGNTAMYQIMTAANYLDVSCLLDTCCKAVADLVRVRNPEQVRALFHIDDDLTPEQKQSARNDLLNMQCGTL